MPNASTTSDRTATDTDSNDPIRAVDLFCGAGGLSAGLALAAEELDREVELAAVNHDAIAVESHKANHPWADHYNAKVEELHPPSVIDPGVDIIAGGFQCTHFSRARGGAPVKEQMRTSPWHLLHWVELLRPAHVLVENVPECWPWGLDIRYRMLQPRELAAAMGFPSDYTFAGNKTETTRQIGNAVPVNLAKALIEKLLVGEEPSLSTFTPAKGVEADD